MEQALDRLMPLVTTSCTGWRHRYMAGERPGHPLQTDGARQRGLPAARRFGAAFGGRTARTSSPSPPDHAAHPGRRRPRPRPRKRGGDAVQVSFDGCARRAAKPARRPDGAGRCAEDAGDVRPRQARSWSCASSAGLSLEETAEVLTVSVGTVRRDWSLAQAWLYRELTGMSRP